MHDDSAMPTRQLLEGNIDRNAGRACQSFEHHARNGVGRIGPQGDGTFGQRQLWIAEERRRIGTDFDA